MDPKILSETAAALFAEHGLVGWTFGLTAAKRRLGVCKYRRKRSEISDYYARHTPDAAVIDTLRHEIAHVPAGPEAGHGPGRRGRRSRPASGRRRGRATTRPIPSSNPATGESPARRAAGPITGTNAPARCPATAPSARHGPRSCSPTPATRPASPQCRPQRNQSPRGGTRTVPAAGSFTGGRGGRRWACGGAGAPPAAS